MVLAYDVGTSGVKAVVVDDAGTVLGSRVRTYGLVTTGAGHVEQDIDAIMVELGRASREVLAAVGVDPADVVGIAVTAQMFSVVPVDPGGRPLRPMISWLDQRAAPEAAAIRAAADERGDDGFGAFDAVLTAKDIVPRIAWLAEHESETDARTAWYLDCKEAVVARLTGAVAIDPSGASAFRLLDAHTGTWDHERCRRAGVPVERLPPIRPGTDVVGGLTTDAALLTGLRAGTAVVTGAGDVPASQIGAGAVSVGDAHLSLGTALYLGITADRHVTDPGRRLGPLRHVAPPGWLLWLEVATGGAALSWLQRQVTGPGDAPGDHAALDAAVDSVAGEMEGLQFVPWLTGERVPLFDDDVRAAFIGLSLHHGRAHLARAVMEGVASQIAWAYEYGLAYGLGVGTIRAVGGGSIGPVWTRLIAEALGRPIEVMGEPQDAGARGAAACALVGRGLAADIRTAVPARVRHVVEPDPQRIAAAAARMATFRALYPAIRHLSSAMVQAGEQPVGIAVGAHS